MPEPLRPSTDAERPFVGVHLKCCHVYVRLYANADRSAFVGWCPRCAAPVRIAIVEEGGSRSRFFEAS
ncbi:MAG TPA: hypothetical protein VML55_11270 [Planctomycetaceae bacterium]|nr:hypothetical protein [Planctomycetaceae bacterium]